MPSASGIDIARKIRKQDFNSVINFITSHNEVGTLLLRERLMFLSFVCKFDDFDKKLTLAVEESLKLVDEKLALRFEENGTLYTIPLADILYIYSENKKTIIVTNYTHFKIKKSLKEIEKIVNNKVRRANRSCIVNTANINKIDKKTNTIYFTKAETKLFSNQYKKDFSND